MILNTKYRKAKGFTLISAGRLGTLRSCQRRFSDINVRHPGFTLIELLVVIIIIAILIGMGTFTWRKAQEKTRDSQRKNDLVAIQQALESYYNANGKYPLAGRQDWSFGWGGGCPSQPWGHPGSGAPCNNDPNFDLRAALLPYIATIPVDPLNLDTNSAFNLGYHYVGAASGLSYEIFANLENNSDASRNCTNCDYLNYADYRVVNP